MQWGVLAWRKGLITLTYQVCRSRINPSKVLIARTKIGHLGGVLMAEHGDEVIKKTVKEGETVEQLVGRAAESEAAALEALFKLTELIHQIAETRILPFSYHAPAAKFVDDIQDINNLRAKGARPGQSYRRGWDFD
jgi:hypothetical protein